MHNLPFKALYTFAVVARCNNFQDAAKLLFVTPSAVSHQIKNLELYLGNTLFLRKGNQLKLLPQAEHLAKALNASFSDINTACDALRPSAPSRKLVIAAIPSVATCWLIPRLKDFQRSFPDIDLRITYAMYGTTLDFNAIDIAFVYANTPPQLPNIKTQLFRSAKSYPVCSAEFYNGYLSNHADITKGPFLQDSNMNDGWPQWFKKAGSSAPNCHLGLAFDDFNLLRSAALSGQGVALCAKALIADDLASKRLVLLSDISINEDAGYYLLQKQQDSAELKQQSQVFIDWVLAS